MPVALRPVTALPAALACAVGAGVLYWLSKRQDQPPNPHKQALLRMGSIVMTLMAVLAIILMQRIWSLSTTTTGRRRFVWRTNTAIPQATLFSA